MFMNFTIGNDSSQTWSIPCTRKRASLIRFGKFSTPNNQVIDNGSIQDTVQDIVRPDKCKIVVNDNVHIATYSDSTPNGRSAHIFKNLMKSYTTLRGKSDTQSFKIYSTGRRVVMGMFVMMVSLQKIGGNSMIEVPLKTFGEISQRDIVVQAAQRQKYIDQSQSLNLMIPPSASPKEVNSLLIEGWEMGVKTFYYQRSANPAQELARSILTCAACEG